jgi:hypothetical protein
MTRPDDPFATIPVEILRKIFGHLRNLDPSYDSSVNTDGFTIDKIGDPENPPTDPREIWFSRMSALHLRDGRKWLVPVSRVCRLWHSIATKILYTEIDTKGGSV